MTKQAWETDSQRWKNPFLTRQGQSGRMNDLSPANRSIGFDRHALAVLSASLAAAVLFALFVAGLAWFQKGGIAVPISIAVPIWLSTFMIALPATGILFTIAWPFTRHRGVSGGPVSTVLGAVGGLGLMWTNHAAIGKDASGAELATTALIGAIVGTVYWSIAQGRPSKTEELQAATMDQQGSPPEAA